jgi:hypothetical protein
MALQLLQRARLSKGEHFDTAIGQVVGVTRNRQRARVLRDSSAVENTLHAPTDQKSLTDQVLSRIRWRARAHLSPSRRISAQGHAILRAPPHVPYGPSL